MINKEKLGKEIIELKDGECCKYKSTKTIKGNFLKYYGKPSEQEKDIFPFIAGMLRGRFQWLLPALSWVDKVIYGQHHEIFLDKGDVNFSGKDVENYIEETEKSGFVFRNWQKEILELIGRNVENKLVTKKMILANTGSGKTQVILALSTLTKGRCLTVVPRSVWASIRADAKKFGVEKDILKFSTYESAAKAINAAKSEGTDFVAMILDEPQKGVKNPESKRSLALNTAAENIPIIIAQTGTITAGKGAMDLRAFNALGIDVIPNSERNFQNIFGINPRKEEVSGASYTDENGSERAVMEWKNDGWDIDRLADFLGEFTFEVSEDFISEEIKLKHTKINFQTPRLYNSVLMGLFSSKGVSKRRFQAQQITGGTLKLDNESIKEFPPKNVDKMVWLLDFLRGRGDKSTVIVSAFIGEQDYLQKTLIEEGFEVALISSKSNRNKEFKRFQTGKAKIIILSSKMTTGLNLQAADKIIFYSNGSSPDDRIQAEARIWRSGQENDCEVIDLVCENTLDERVIELLDRHIKTCKSLSGSSLKRSIALGISQDGIKDDLKREFENQVRTARSDV